ncbi:MAG: hypothetical protein M1828_000850 [Chrysothrix sp. TS-e1954]|nr:MAG: hypothetical protein M1828_000850 [Chrysothrix sp. TS-e1954]
MASSSELEIGGSGFDELIEGLGLKRPEDVQRVIEVFEDDNSTVEQRMAIVLGVPRIHDWREFVLRDADDNDELNENDDWPGISDEQEESEISDEQEESEHAGSDDEENEAIPSQRQERLCKRFEVRQETLALISELLGGRPWRKGGEDEIRFWYGEDPDLMDDGDASPSPDPADETGQIPSHANNSQTELERAHSNEADSKELEANEPENDQEAPADDIKPDHKEPDHKEPDGEVSDNEEPNGIGSFGPGPDNQDSNREEPTQDDPNGEDAGEDELGENSDKQTFDDLNGTPLAAGSAPGIPLWAYKTPWTSQLLSMAAYVVDEGFTSNFGRILAFLGRKSRRELIGFLSTLSEQYNSECELEAVNVPREKIALVRCAARENYENELDDWLNEFPWTPDYDSAPEKVKGTLRGAFQKTSDPNFAEVSILCKLTKKTPSFVLTWFENERKRHKYNSVAQLVLGRAVKGPAQTKVAETKEASRAFNPAWARHCERQAEESIPYNAWERLSHFSNQAQQQQNGIVGQGGQQ